MENLRLIVRFIIERSGDTHRDGAQRRQPQPGDTDRITQFVGIEITRGRKDVTDIEEHRRPHFPIFQNGTGKDQLRAGDGLERTAAWFIVAVTGTQRIGLVTPHRPQATRVKFSKKGKPSVLPQPSP